MSSTVVLNEVRSEQDEHTLAHELITVAAHDLKNLLTPLRNRIDLIALRAGHEHRRRDLRDASEALLAIKRLEQLIFDVLDAERLDHGLFTIRPTAVDLSALTRETARMLQGTTEIHVHASDEVVIFADPSKLRQSLENVIANAVRHSPADVPVTVTVESERDDGTARAIVTITDQGPGIPPERMHSLFQPYQLGELSSGLGLGLYLAREIVSAHGGTLTAHSVPGSGTSFRFSLRILAGAASHTVP